jgi:hypothetical protein
MASFEVPNLFIKEIDFKSISSPNNYLFFNVGRIIVELKVTSVVE